MSFDWRPYKSHPWLAILPFGLMLGALVPLSFFAGWLAAVFGLPSDIPTKSLLGGFVWLIIILTLNSAPVGVVPFLATFVVSIILLLAGDVIGWLANALICRFLLGWPSEKIRTVFAGCGALLPRLKWLEDDAQSSEQKQILS